MTNKKFKCLGCGRALTIRDYKVYISSKGSTVYMCPYCNKKYKLLVLKSNEEVNIQLKKIKN